MKSKQSKLRIFGVILIFTLLLANVGVYASSMEKSEVIFSQAKEKAVKMKKLKFEDNNSIVDLTPVSEKSTSKVKKAKKGTGMVNYSLAENPVDKSRIIWHRGLLVDDYAVAASLSTVMEDFISAQARIYDTNLVLVDKDTQEQTYSAFVSATAYSGIGNPTNYPAIGNHVYRLEGYKDVIHETYSEN